MRVLVRDTDGYLMVQECHTVTAVTCATCNDPSVIKRDFELDQDSSSFEGIAGVHLMPLGGDVIELFVPCDNGDYRVMCAYQSGMLDMSDCSLVYDADDWELY